MTYVMIEPTQGADEAMLKTALENAEEILRFWQVEYEACVETLLALASDETDPSSRSFFDAVVRFADITRIRDRAMALHDATRNLVCDIESLSIVKIWKQSNDIIALYKDLWTAVDDFGSF
jgi:hypothetical protein